MCSFVIQDGRADEDIRPYETETNTTGGGGKPPPYKIGVWSGRVQNLRADEDNSPYQREMAEGQ